MRTFTSPRWLGRYALAALAVLVLSRIGLWQWHKARGSGSWQNYGYAVQWWLFAGFAVFLLVKVVLDELDPARLEPSDPRVDLPPDLRPTAPAPTVDDDDELAAYNRHLAWLNDKASR